MAVPICSRLPDWLVERLDEDCRQQGLTRSEIITACLVNYYTGVMPLIGADEGYLAARRLTQALTYEVLRRALADLPDNHEDAVALLRQTRNHLG